MRTIFVEAKELMSYQNDVEKRYIESIANLTLNYDGKLYLLAKSDFDCEKLEMLKTTIKKRFNDFTVHVYNTTEDEVNFIKETLGMNYDFSRNRVLVIGSVELRRFCWSHMINKDMNYVNFEDDAEFEIDNAFWCEDTCEKRNVVKGFEKVIFLDIDGVLNDDNNYSKDPVYVKEEYVRELAWLVYKTKASIILTSSWRYELARGFRTIGIEQSEPIEILLKLFKKYNIEISGITPLYFNGPDGRPFEIRKWLADKSQVKKFVILDDEDFWRWNWLKPNFVCTSESYYDEEGRIQRRCGLTRELAKEAVKILE